jgi:prolyl-tRNA editing enzyme YbaK/EbsC (Cys-tRNA(Pro) deacylase)
MTTTAGDRTVLTASGKFGAGATTDYLKHVGIPYELLEHRPTFRAADEAASTGIPPHLEAKTLVVKGTSGMVLVTLPASERLSLRKLRPLLGDHSLRFAREREIASAFPHFDVGAMPPFGALASVPLVMDERLFGLERVTCSAGDHRHSLVLCPADLAERLCPFVGDVCED